ncbi:MAG: helix-turn-helix domain-containing protein [Clostridiales bacterium]|nr:helix-turn-helix domain-containing protein [Clostridiales bacterium]
MTKLREIRKAKGMTQEELAKKAGISRTVVWGLETGRCSATTTRTLINLAKALECSVADIFFSDAV